MQTIFATVNVTNHSPMDPHPTPPILGFYATEREADFAALYAESWVEQPDDSMLDAESALAVAEGFASPLSARPVIAVTQLATYVVGDEPDDHDNDMRGMSEADAAWRRN